MLGGEGGGRGGEGRGGEANSVVHKYVDTHIHMYVCMYAHAHTQTAAHKDVGHWLPLSLHCEHHMSNLKDVRSLL